MIERFMREAMCLSIENAKIGGGPFGALSPMCLGLIYWAHLDKIYYVNTRKDDQDIGFADNLIYSELNLPASKRTIPLIPLEMEEAKIAFHVWEKFENKGKY